MDDHDIRVAEGRRGFGLLDEPLFAFGVGDLVRRQDLDGDGPVEMGVNGLVDGAHPAFAGLLDDPVVEERLANQSGITHSSRPRCYPYKSGGAEKSIRAGGGGTPGQAVLDTVLTFS
jgi:hypothetical protein